MRFTKRPTPAQVRQGLALFAMAADYAREAKKARQAHAIEAGATNNRPDDCDTGRGSASAAERNGDRTGKVGKVPVGRLSRGDEEPRQSGDFRDAISTTVSTGGPRHV